MAIARILQYYVNWLQSALQLDSEVPTRGVDIKKRGGFCRPPRQLYPQEERGIQRYDNTTFGYLTPSVKTLL